MKGSGEVRARRAVVAPWRGWPRPARAPSSGVFCRRRGRICLDPVAMNCVFSASWCCSVILQGYTSGLVTRSLQSPCLGCWDDRVGASSESFSRLVSVQQRRR
jgi:hypothetical protein